MVLNFILSKRKLIIFLGTIPWFSLTFMSAQRTDIYQLEAQYRTAPTLMLVTELSRAYQEQADWFRYIPQFNLDSTVFYFDKAIVLLENTKPLPFENLAEAYKNKSEFYYHVYKFPESVVAAKKARTYFEEMTSQKKQNTLLQYDILSNWSLAEVDNKNANYGLELFSKALALLQENTDIHIQALLLKDKGVFYSRYNNGLEQRDLGYLPFLEKSRGLYESFHNPQDNATLVTIYDNISWYYNVIEKYDSCDYYDAKIEILLPVLNDPLVSARFYVLKGNNYYRRKKYQEARKFTEQGRTIAETYKLEYTTIYTFSTFVLGTIFQKEGNYYEAAQYFTRAKELKNKNNYGDGNLSYLEAMTDLYEQKGDYPKALAFQKQLLDSTLSFVNRNSNDNLKKSELQLDVLKKEKELAQKRIETNLFVVAIAFVLLLLGLFAFYYNRERKRKAELEKQNHVIEEQAQALLQLDAAKTRFFANVSHELRTPLTLILGPLGSALKSNSLDGKNTTLVSLAKQHGQKLLSLVNEILDLTKLESGNMTTHEEATDVYNFLRRLISTLESYAEQRQINLVFDYDDNAPRGLMVDKPKLEKVFNNLISNALKFTPQGGTVTVKIKHDKSHWQLIVHDTGRGIHPDDLPHVFNRFYQTNQSNIAIEGGTGIGLALSKELAQVMGGNIKVESILNEGATFTLSLPKKEVWGISKEQINGFDEEINETITGEDSFVHPILLTENGNGKNNNATILVVEDNASLRNYLKLILSDKYNVVTAENGQEGLDKLRITNYELRNDFNNVANESDSSVISHQSSLKKLPDLIISDIMMPVMDGFQFIEKLKTEPHLSHIPIIMLTARAEMQDRIKALRIGVDDYLTKPFEEEELFARIKNLLNNAQVRKEIRQEAHQEFLQEQEQGQHSTPNTQYPIPNTQHHFSTEDLEWLNELKNTVQKHIGDYNLSVETIADLMHASRAPFFRRVQLLTGLTPHQYLQEIRFNHARQLLEHRSVSSVKAVAATIGIRKIQYFSEQFKERFGKLPSDYLDG